MNFRFVLAFLFLTIFFATAAVAQKPPVKKNARPSSDAKIEKTTQNIAKGEIVYAYEFSKPEFVVSKIVIEHDENGVGQIRFQKKDFEEDIVEPLKLSKGILEKISGLWQTVGFLDSTEKYQSKERDYGHLGTMKLRMNRNGTQRIDEFNWTENLEVRALTQEYRKIATQAVWVFDFEVAKQNQPLRTPRMMTGLDSHLRRDGISDQHKMLMYLKKVSTDESVPLIARNHATRLVKRIEKNKATKKETPEEKK